MRLTYFFQDLWGSVICDALCVCVFFPFHNCNCISKGEESSYSFMLCALNYYIHQSVCLREDPKEIRHPGFCLYRCAYLYTCKFMYMHKNLSLEYKYLSTRIVPLLYDCYRTANTRYLSLPHTHRQSINLQCSLCLLPRSYTYPRKPFEG